ncbi:hypothetical protein FOCC_FOCC013864 [Frankliniella occidentalis]|nr:hypothetical protein FOCC_FOCC013864 [Frankliniella occidentalis]
MLKTKVLHTLANANDNDAEINDIEAMFRVLENPFAEIANEAQRITALKNAGAYIGSTEYLIGSSLKENLGQMIGDFIPGNEEVWLYYLCLLELLQMVLAPSFRIEAEML